MNQMEKYCLSEGTHEEYRPTPNPDAERLIGQVVAAGIPRWVAEPAIVKYDAECSSRVAYG